MRYLIGLLIFIFLIIFVIIKLLTGGGEEQQPETSLGSYSDTGVTVRYIIDTPINAPENHRTIAVEVGRNNTNFSLIKGYDGEVIRSQDYPMSEAAYAEFLLALDKTGGYTLGNKDESVQDERGYCATGNRYSYDIVDEDGGLLQHLWSTSCKERTFKGVPDAVRALFIAQVPNFDELTEGVEY